MENWLAAASSCLAASSSELARFWRERDWWAASRSAAGCSWDDWAGRLIRLFWEEELARSSHLSLSSGQYGPGFFRMPLSKLRRVHK